LVPHASRSIVVVDRAIVTFAFWIFIAVPCSIL
jgi:hypothetical protein